MRNRLAAARFVPVRSATSLNVIERCAEVKARMTLSPRTNEVT
jgi:hypothetical protein